MGGWLPGARVRAEDRHVGPLIAGPSHGRGSGRAPKRRYAQANATIRVRSGVHLLAGLKWIHVSNNGLAGRDRNPDIEAVGPTLGVLLGF